MLKDVRVKHNGEVGKHIVPARHVPGDGVELDRNPTLKSSLHLIFHHPYITPRKPLHGLTPGPKFGVQGSDLGACGSLTTKYQSNLQDQAGIPQATLKPISVAPMEASRAKGFRVEGLEI